MMPYEKKVLFSQQEAMAEKEWLERNV